MDLVDEYIEALLGYDRLAPQIRAHRVMQPCVAEFADKEHGLSANLGTFLKREGIERLYSHQIESLEAVRAGIDIVVATPTASGKSMTYNLPVIENLASSKSSTAIYLFPLKALAQDQMKIIDRISSAFGPLSGIRSAIYDGDTTDSERRRIRNNPPDILITNPEMIHLAIAPYHHLWEPFLKNLKYVVIDEIHTYRGVFGSNMAWVMRRIRRICRYYGSDPVFIMISATIGNPENLASELVARGVKGIRKSGAPQGKKHFVMINALEEGSSVTISLLKSAMARNLRTIVYCQSRKMTELIALWASRNSGEFRERISSYRAGFLPEERRDIEKKMSSGELLAVVSTSALELGIDIGGLDICILVGYPGTVMSTWQRAGRVGRRNRSSAVILIGGEDALDQYIMSSPDSFFDMPPEQAVINPLNSVIMKRHLECAASELPIDLIETGKTEFFSGDKIAQAILELESEGKLLRSAGGETLLSARKYPQRSLNLRGIGSSFKIMNQATSEVIGDIDGHRVFSDTHPGAIYLHRGEHYEVTELDFKKAIVMVSETGPHLFTRSRNIKDTRIVSAEKSSFAGSAAVFLGRVEVTEQVTSYEKRLVKGQKLIAINQLDLPSRSFETEGFWIEIPEKLKEKLVSEEMHFMGAIHALEHAMIGLLPMLVMADRNDFGGISIPFHPQTGKACVFVYDGFPGGMGLSRSAFDRICELLEKVEILISKCRCETGCPACVHSPKCGSGNRPIDKLAALFLSKLILAGCPEQKAVSESAGLLERYSSDHAAFTVIGGTDTKSGSRRYMKGQRYGVLDLETQKSAQEVGGWDKAHLMRISCGVLYDSADSEFHVYYDDQIHSLIEHLKNLDLVIGFNIIRFDFHVLRGYSDFDFWSLPTLDILDVVRQKLGYRLSLDHLAGVTLGEEKSASGLLALKWWKEGKIDLIQSYCQKDVEITERIFRFGLKEKYLLFKNKAGNLVRVQVDFGE
ncbi:DEAD/DEAH box helicase [Desulforegula conservatrix]|uniref:DEAD/DEAH box helicase n=1 Tax=Desulforegula conservatrix TaxID=153026 RepID=UPI000403FAA4|nr:DEAD/DEAH box helicase [Desulforegula conservatrix]